MQTFTPLVLQLILRLALDESISFDVIHAIIVRLHGLAKQFPSALTQDFLAALEAGRKRFAASLRTDYAFPTAKELVLLYAVCQVYPTSDYSHLIVNPTILFMGQILGQMEVKNIQDLARGLFICSLFLQVCYRTSTTYYSFKACRSGLVRKLSISSTLRW